MAAGQDPACKPEVSTGLTGRKRPLGVGGAPTRALQNRARPVHRPPGEVNAATTNGMSTDPTSATDDGGPSRSSTASSEPLRVTWRSDRQTRLLPRQTNGRGGDALG
jgi:hypothetical protein